MIYLVRIVAPVNFRVQHEYFAIKIQISEFVVYGIALRMHIIPRYAIVPLPISRVMRP